MTVQKIVAAVRDGMRIRILEGLPTPHLMALCADGREHEAWRKEWPSSDGTVLVQWRARDDVFDAVHKPADQPYIKVVVGLNPDWPEDDL